MNWDGRLTKDWSRTKIVDELKTVDDDRCWWRTTKTDDYSWCLWMTDNRCLNLAITRRQFFFIFFYFIYTQRKLKTGNTKQTKHSLTNAATIRTQPTHTLTDRQPQLIYHRCCCVQVLYIPRGPGEGGSAPTFNYMFAKALKTEICS